MTRIPRAQLDTLRAERDRHQRVLSCVTQGVLLLDDLRPSYVLSFGGRKSESVGGGLRLGVMLEYSAATRLGLTGYMFRLLTDEGREILAYHYNPEGPEARAYPHLHLGPAADVGMRALTRAHLPTGMVALADVLRLVIEDLGVKPRRADWRSVLDTPTAR